MQKIAKIAKQNPFLRDPFFNQKKSEKDAILEPNGKPQAIEPDLAGERKAHVESDVTVLLSAAICGIWCYNVAI